MFRRLVHTQPIDNRSGQYIFMDNAMDLYVQYASLQYTYTNLQYSKCLRSDTYK